MRSGVPAPLRLAIAILVAGALGGCAGPAETRLPPTLTPTARPTARPTATIPSPSRPAGEPVQVVLVSTAAWPGGSTVLFVLEDAANLPIEDPGLTVAVTATEASPPVGGEAASTGGAASLVHVRSSGRALYRLDLDFARPGDWRLSVVAGSPTRSYAGETAMTVLDPGATPGRGDPAPNAHTPTAADAGQNLGNIVTAPYADPRFYETSADEAARSGKPFVLVLDSPRFRASSACGRAITMAIVVARNWRDVTFIHAEPFATTSAAGFLILDPPEGPIRWSAWAEAWGLGPAPWGVESSPWIFVVDAAGRVHATFHGIIGSDELEIALADVTPG
jgi:hypothetical protein